ncbi:MAG: methyltransferase, partial [Eubacteriales bacterium]|nr:methyltransferase [Eubacteriales bacterium]
VGKRGAKGAIQFEVQEQYCEMAQRTIEYNKLSDNIQVVCGDIGDKTIVPREKFDVVLCNPPYFPPKSGGITELDSAAIARHEILCDVTKVTTSAAWALKYGGKLAIIHRPERLVDILTDMRASNIEPKRICLVCSRINQPPVMILVEGVKGGKSGILWDNPIIVYNDDGTYTQQINEIYGRY